jgi:aminopeptidase N
MNWEKSLTMKKQIWYYLLIIFLSFSCGGSIKKMLEPGVSIELAKYRKKFISDIQYNLFISIPAERDSAVTGRIVIDFHQSRAQRGVVLDFRGGEENIHMLRVNGSPEPYQYLNEHIILSSRNIIPGKNQVEIHFTSTDQALNRSEDFMYTLFVPDRASTAFPCFDQPDLKALFELKLEIPATWTALSNGPLIDFTIEGDRKTLFFEPDQPISTYLMAFAAGVFDTVSQTSNGRTIKVFHRETDQRKLESNLGAIFSQHFKAIDWLEEYTGIDYPFKKLDMALLPGFQYSGMEHPGSIWYRDVRLLLDEQAPISSHLAKASLIAHETAHMWFGNLVTMQWFDDVWLKEVFAGFMADKIVQPQFPDIDHQLQFLLTHYPRAYAVDRSQGTHPIKQKLENMNLAGTLYGAIIYNKAPIVFQQLEWLMGHDDFKLAVREYLETFSYNNSDWNDLAEIFDRYSTLDLKSWSKAWVYGQGRPTITFEYLFDQGSLNGVKLFSSTGQDIEHFPAQKLRPAFQCFNDQTLADEKNWFFDASPQVFELNNTQGHPKMLILNGGGAGYGYMVPDLSTRRFLLEELPFGQDNYLKAAGFVNLHEDFLEGRITPESYIQALATAISGSKNPQIIRYLLGNLQLVYWRFISEDERKQLCHPLETMLWEKLVEAPRDQKALLLDAFIGMAISRQALVKIEQLLSKQLSVWGLKVSEEQRFSMVAALLLNERPRAKAFSERLMATTTNPDRLRRMQFVLPALDDDQQVRDHFFENLAHPANRRPEPWVIEALNYLNHPLRASSSIKYLPKSLKMLEEIQQTGDIFFPLNWLEASLWGHCSPEAAKIVDDFLNDPEFTNVNLKLKTLQAADLLFRASQRRKV